MMKNTFLQVAGIYFLVLISIGCHSQSLDMKVINKNGMRISWNHRADRIFFEMTAPTNGWVTIGFNTSSGTTGAYLLMGNVIKGKTQVEEHYTLSPGNYRPISSLGAKPQIQDIEGIEKKHRTSIKFSLPIKALSKYQRDLIEGMEYIMLIAYSQEDDFQHHSNMRTSVKVKL